MVNLKPLCDAIFESDCDEEMALLVKCIESIEQDTPWAKNLYIHNKGRDILSEKSLEALLTVIAEVEDEKAEQQAAAALQLGAEKVTDGRVVDGGNCSSMKVKKTEGSGSSKQRQPWPRRARLSPKRAKICDPDEEEAAALPSPPASAGLNS
ncbi:uncharacterized protein LOC110723221 [Chenopodium quinoa]|uniref:uncharacterized protein LOC110723221 n=1 Tax=Chenopodium quinoa TaxID=63459 RepID=UPI000B76BA94|nr:uncharacterized protein LOC110723221 [Chenopodium quinoa]